MEHARHEAIARWERLWMAIMGGLLVVLVVFIVYSLALEGGHIGQRAERTVPGDLERLEMFRSPGLIETGTGRYSLSVVAQAFSFVPSTVDLPVGADVTFFASSRDVLHGYHVHDTNINVELIPGEVATWTYTFRRPGQYRVACNEYCGISHHNMLGVINVLPESEFAALQEERADAAAAAGDSSLAVGEQVYSSSCAGCHQGAGQGIPGVFPPLSGHAADLYQADGGRNYLLNVVLHGMIGPIDIGGTTYAGVMPAWGQLSDEQVAAVLNYVLASWDNAGRVDEEPYAPSDVAPLRDPALTPDEVHAQRLELEVGE